MGKYKIRLTQSAKKDILLAKKYYSEIRPTLGLRFAEAANDKQVQIQTEPFAYTKRYKNVRFAILETFPFAYHFIIEEVKKEVIIIGLFHEKMNPETWR